MSLLNREPETKTTKAAGRDYYGNTLTHSPAGGITASEFSDIKEGGTDRESGKPRCAFCRQARPLKTGNGTTCDTLCEEYQYGWVPWGRPYPSDKERGRGWLSII